MCIHIIYICLIITLWPQPPKQGHLTRFLSYGLGLRVTTIEADAALVEMASKFDRELEWTLDKEQKKVSTGWMVVL